MLRFREEWQSGPLGATLAEATLELQPAVRDWLVVRFPRPIVLDARPYWLLVRAASGRATWLTNPGSAGLSVLQEQNARFDELSRLDGVEALSYFLSAQENLASGAPVRLSVGNHSVTGTADDTRRTFDLKSEVTAELSGAATTGIITLPLVFASELPGVLTVRAPRIEYDL